MYFKKLKNIDIDQYDKNQVIFENNTIEAVKNFFSVPLGGKSLFDLFEFEEDLISLFDFLIEKKNEKQLEQILARVVDAWIRESISYSWHNDEKYVSSNKIILSIIKKYNKENNNSIFQIIPTELKNKTLFYFLKGNNLTNAKSLIDLVYLEGENSLQSFFNTIRSSSNYNAELYNLMLKDVHALTQQFILKNLVGEQSLKDVLNYMFNYTQTMTSDFLNLVKSRIDGLNPEYFIELNKNVIDAMKQPHDKDVFLTAINSKFLDKNVIIFYLNQIKNNSLKVADLKMTKSIFFEFFKDERFWDGLMKKSPPEFSICFDLYFEIKNKLFFVNEKDIAGFEEILKTTIENNGHKFWGKDLNKRINVLGKTKDFNYSKIISNALAEGEGQLFESFIDDLGLDLNKEIVFSHKGKTYSNLLEYLENQDSIIVNMNKFAKNPSKKLLDKLMEKIDLYETKFPLKSSDVKIIFDFIKKDKNPKQLFEHLFVNIKIPENKKNTSWLLKEFSRLFRAEVGKMVFDLPEENPIERLINNNLNSGAFDIRNAWAIEIIADIIGLRLYDFKTTKNITTRDFCKNFQIDISVSSYESEGLGFLSLFRSSKSPCQIVVDIQNNKLDLIYNKSEKLVNTSIDGMQKSEKSIDLIDVAEKNLEIFKEFVNKNSEKEISIEVKILAEQMLLNYQKTCKAVDENNISLSSENMYFFKESFSKYVFQCLNVYVKAVERYEMLKNAELSFNKEKEDQLENHKIKIDKEAQKQLTLLNDEFNQIKKNLISDLTSEDMTAMKIQTRILEQRNTTQDNEILNSNVVEIKNKVA